MNSIKKLFYVASLVIAVLCFQFFGATFNITKVFAETNTNYEKITISNGNFDSDKSSGLTTSPSSWSEITGTGSATKGVIKTTATNFSSETSTGAKTYYLSENPLASGDDDYALMINSKTSSGMTAVLGGFKSASITLDAYSYYTISVDVKTIANSSDTGAQNAKASVVLSGVDGELVNVANTNYFSGISQGDPSYQTYTFFIQTSFESQTVYLELYLGDVTSNNKIASKGAVFFDTVLMNKVNQNTFVGDYNNTATQYRNLIDYTIYNEDVSSLNFDFEDNWNGWTEIDGDHTSNYSIKTGTDLGLDNTLNNTRSLIIQSTDDANYVGVKSSEFDIFQNAKYRISVNVKVENLDGNAYLYLFESDTLTQAPYNRTTYTPSSTNLVVASSTEGEALMNGYSTFEFYIAGHELYNTKAYLELSLGNTDSKTTGTVSFDSISIEYVPYDIFTSVSTGTTTASLTLSVITTAVSYNGDFNVAHTETALPSYPLVADSWTRTTPTTATASELFGVLNTNTNEWDSDVAPSINPGNPDRIVGTTTISGSSISTNNILMIANTSASYQQIESPSFEISSNSFYKISFNYLTNKADFLHFKLLGSNNNVVYTDTASKSSGWSLYEITVNTEYYSSTLKLVLELGEELEEKAGYVYFDNFEVTSLDSEPTHNEHFVDFSNSGFNLIGEEISSNVYEALMFKSSGNSVNFGGIIDNNNGYDITFPENTSRLIVIQTNEQDSSYSLKARDSISLSADTFYKFTVKIKTSFVSITSETDFGAYFLINGVDEAKIENIKNDSDFAEYSIFVKIDSDTTAIVEFGLTSGDNSNTNGAAFFSNYSYETITQKSYTSAVASTSLIKVNNLNIEEETEDDDDTTTDQGSVNIWIAISTLVMVLAMVIAIVGAFLRKIQIKKFKVKRQAEYDRQITLVRDVAFAEAEKRRDQEIKNLQAEKEQLKIYMQELDQDNKNRIAEERKVHGKEITRQSEREFKIYVSHRQKLVKDMDKLDAKIKEANSPEYLMRIIKIVQNEKAKEIMDKKDKERELANSQEKTKPTTDDKSSDDKQ